MRGEALITQFLSFHIGYQDQVLNINDTQQNYKRYSIGIFFKLLITTF